MKEEMPDKPDKWTVAMGELIKKAREEAGLTQEQLAEKIYRKRLAVNELEHGRVEISVWVLPLLARALKKPITYFFPNIAKSGLEREGYSDQEKELILLFREIWEEHLRDLVIKEVRVISEFDPESMIWDMVPLVADEKQRDKLIEERLAEKKKNK